MSQGELALARPYLERALAIRERRLRREPPRAVRSRRRLEELAKQLVRSQTAG